MESLMFLVAEMSSRDEIVENIKEAIAEYEQSKDDKSFKGIEMWSMVLLAKTKMRLSGQDTIAAVKEFEEHKKRKKLFDIDH